mgnify:CR=1 FL=1
MKMVSIPEGTAPPTNESEIPDTGTELNLSGNKSDEEPETDEDGIIIPPIDAITASSTTQEIGAIFDESFDKLAGLQSSTLLSDTSETQTATSTIDGQSVSFSFNETSNYLQVPPDILGITKVFHFDGSNRMSSGMFSLKYQLFLNDVYFYGSTELLTYAMTKTYLEDINFLLTTQKQIRFNKRQDRLYLDIDWSSITDGEFLVIDCYRTLDPNDYARVFNDSFLKRYFTAHLKKQWGQNLIKFQGVKLPGGIELNGRQIYDDAMNDIAIIREQMSNTYEIPPLDFIG